MSRDNHAEEYYSLDDTAKLLEISIETLKGALQNSRIPFHIKATPPSGEYLRKKDVEILLDIKRSFHGEYNPEAFVNALLLGSEGKPEEIDVDEIDLWTPIDQPCNPHPPKIPPDVPREPVPDFD